MHENVPAQQGRSPSESMTPRQSNPKNWNKGLSRQQSESMLDSQEQFFEEHESNRRNFRTPRQNRQNSKEERTRASNRDKFYESRSSRERDSDFLGNSSNKELNHLEQDEEFDLGGQGYNGGQLSARGGSNFYQDQEGETYLQGGNEQGEVWRNYNKRNGNDERRSSDQRNHNPDMQRNPTAQEGRRKSQHLNEIGFSDISQSIKKPNFEKLYDPIMGMYYSNNRSNPDATTYFDSADNPDAGNIPNAADQASASNYRDIRSNPEGRKNLETSSNPQAKGLDAWMNDHQDSQSRTSDQPPHQYSRPSNNEVFTGEASVLEEEWVYDEGAQMSPPWQSALDDQRTEDRQLATSFPFQESYDSRLSRREMPD